MTDKQYRAWLRIRLEDLVKHCNLGKDGFKKKINSEEINRRLQALAVESDKRTPGESVAAVSGVLSRVGKRISLKVEATHTPSEYFVTREGLYVWSDFKDRVLKNATPTESGTSFKLDTFKLEKDASDEQIESSLPKKHLFSETEVCAIVAELTSKQSKGEEGVLLNNGYANLFYTESFVVHVDWSSSGRGWGVYAWRRDDSGWFGGVRVVSPAH